MSALKDFFGFVGFIACGVTGLFLIEAMCRSVKTLISALIWKYKAVTNVFSDSYEYRRKYKEFVKEMKEKGIKPRKD